MTLRASLTVIGLLVIMSLAAQHRNDNWVFPNYLKLSFASSPPVVSIGGLVSTNTTGSISDENGDLLFYSDGNTIWTATDQVMTNGDGIMGDPGHMIIVPHPGVPTWYYVFSVDRFHPVFAPDASFGYSVVDMSMNGGLGEVVVKNVLLDTLIGNKITATLHEDGDSYWIVVKKLNNDEFHAYRLSTTGFTAVPVVSNAGTPYPINSVNAGTGQMQFSRSGQRLATRLVLPPLRIAQLFKFSNTSGTVFDAIELSSPFDPTHSINGLEFSPNGDRLYVTTYFPPTSRLYQYDLTSWDSLTIANSKILIDSMDNSGGNGGWLLPELAPDNKIYLALNGEDTIAVINEPNALGLACNFDSGAIPIPSDVRLFPNHILDYHDDFLGVTQNDWPDDLEVRPNPANNYVVIDLDQDWAGMDLQLEWQDVRGRQLRVVDLDFAQKVRTSVQEFQSGMYFLNLFGNNELIGTTRVVIR